MRHIICFWIKSFDYKLANLFICSNQILITCNKLAVFGFSSHMSSPIHVHFELIRRFHQHPGLRNNIFGLFKGLNNSLNLNLSNSASWQFEFFFWKMFWFLFTIGKFKVLIYLQFFFFFVRISFKSLSHGIPEN